MVKIGYPRVNELYSLVFKQCVRKYLLHCGLPLMSLNMYQSIPAMHFRRQFCDCAIENLYAIMVDH